MELECGCGELISDKSIKEFNSKIAIHRVSMKHWEFQTNLQIEEDQKKKEIAKKMLGGITEAGSSNY